MSHSSDTRLKKLLFGSRGSGRTEKNRGTEKNREEQRKNREEQREQREQRKNRERTEKEQRRTEKNREEQRNRQNREGKNREKQKRATRNKNGPRINLASMASVLRSNLYKSIGAHWGFKLKCNQQYSQYSCNCRGSP